MNKDIKTLKEEMQEVRDNPTFWVEDYGEMESMVTFEADECKTLLDYINKLETNIDEAIEYIKEHIKYECDDAFNGMEFYSYHLYDFSNKKLLSILERGKE